MVGHLDCFLVCFNHWDCSPIVAHFQFLENEHVTHRTKICCDRSLEVGNVSDSPVTRVGADWTAAACVGVQCAPAKSNVWEWMKNGKIEVVDMEALHDEMPWTNMTHVYPSPRIERIFLDFARNVNHPQNEYFLRNFCEAVPFTYLEMTIQQGYILPPGGQRFSKPNKYASVHVDC